MIIFPMPIDSPIVQWPSVEHPAYDFACYTGEPIYAVHDGYMQSNYSRTHGNQAVMQYNGHTTTYSHMEHVFPAGWYQTGEQIGTCGNTGAWSYGPHLHFESTYTYRF